MGLFGKRDKAAALEPVTESEGYCGIAVCAQYSDGVMNAQEDERVLDALRELQPGEDEASLRESLVKMASLAKRHGDGNVLRHSASAIPLARREAAFRLAADIVVADGEIEQPERDFLERFRVALGLDVLQAQRVLDGLR